MLTLLYIYREAHRKRNTGIYLQHSSFFDILVDFIFEEDTKLSKNHVYTCSPLGGCDTTPLSLEYEGYII